MASLKEIAKETRLAEATVSRILRQQDQCAPETRDRVLEVARRLKYRPNMLVRGMQTGRSKTVGVMLPLGAEFFGRVFQGVHEALVQADHVPLVLWCYDELDGGAINQRQPSELKQIYRLLDRRVDGVILRPVDDAIDDAYLREVWERQLPLIAIDRQLEHTHADFVGVDNLEIGRSAAAQLLRLGHRRLGHVTGPETVTTSRLRRQGFEAEVASAGGTCVTVVDPSFGENPQAARDLVGSPTPPTAIFAANDVLAMHVYAAARERGLRIPQDLSVIGCGDLSIAAALFPKLQTFDQNPHATGREAASLLLGRLDRAASGGLAERTVPTIRYVPFKIVPGDSVASIDLT